MIEGNRCEFAGCDLAPIWRLTGQKGGNHWLCGEHLAEFAATQYPSKAPAEVDLSGILAKLHQLHSAVCDLRQVTAEQDKQIAWLKGKAH